MMPSKIHICGIPYTIKLYDDNFDMDLHFGEIKYGQAEIRINKNVTPELQMQALFHEIIHGILVQMGRNDESQDEQLVQGLANAIYQSFKLKEGT